MDTSQITTLTQALVAINAVQQQGNTLITLNIWVAVVGLVSSVIGLVYIARVARDIHQKVHES